MGTSNGWTFNCHRADASTILPSLCSHGKNCSRNLLDLLSVFKVVDTSPPAPDFLKILLRFPQMGDCPERTSFPPDNRSPNMRATLKRRGGSNPCKGVSSERTTRLRRPTSWFGPLASLSALQSRLLGRVHPAGPKSSVRVSQSGAAPGGAIIVFV